MTDETEHYQAGYRLGYEGVVVRPPKGLTPEQMKDWTYGHNDGLDRRREHST